jgi:hypothetical protein
MFDLFSSNFNVQSHILSHEGHSDEGHSDVFTNTRDE